MCKFIFAESPFHIPSPMVAAVQSSYQQCGAPCPTGVASSGAACAVPVQCRGPPAPAGLVVSSAAASSLPDLLRSAFPPAAGPHGGVACAGAGWRRLTLRLHALCPAVPELRRARAAASNVLVRLGSGGSGGGGGGAAVSGRRRHSTVSARPPEDPMLTRQPALLLLYPQVIQHSALH